MKISNNQIESYIAKIDKEKISGCLIYGPESHLVNYRFNQIAKKIAPDLSDPFLVTNITKERLNNDKGILVDELSSFSMLGGRKLIMIQDCDAAVISVLKSIDRDEIKKSSNFLLVQGGDLEKNSYLRKFFEDEEYLSAVACYEDSDATIKNFISEELRNKSIKFNINHPQLILDRVGKNRMMIKNEIEKLSNYLSDEKVLLDAQIVEITGYSAELSVEEFINYFASKNFDLALKSFQKLVNQGSEVIYILRLLSNYFQKLYQSRFMIEAEGSDIDSAVSFHRLFFKAEPQFRTHLQKFSLKELKTFLRKFNEYEIKFKSSNISQSLLFTDFVASFLAKKII